MERLKPLFTHIKLDEDKYDLNQWLEIGGLDVTLSKHAVIQFMRRYTVTIKKLRRRLQSDDYYYIKLRDLAKVAEEVKGLTFTKWIKYGANAFNTHYYQAKDWVFVIIDDNIVTIYSDKVYSDDNYEEKYLWSRSSNGDRRNRGGTSSLGISKGNTVHSESPVTSKCGGERIPDKRPNTGDLEQYLLKCGL